MALSGLDIRYRLSALPLPGLISPAAPPRRAQCPAGSQQQGEALKYYTEISINYAIKLSVEGKLKDSEATLDKAEKLVLKYRSNPELLSLIQRN